MKIGVFDSGYGGLTVLTRCLKACEETFKTVPTFVYYADQDHAPYGERSSEEVLDLTNQAIQFLIEKEHVDVVVIACNTATSYSVGHLRKHYDIPIIGIEPAIKPASEKTSPSDLILLTATPLMLESERLTALIQQLGIESQVVKVALPGLVRIAEHLEGTWEEKQAMAKTYLKDALPNLETNRYGAVVLGCTHFPLFKGAYASVLEEVEQFPYFADGSLGVALRLIQTIQEMGGIRTQPKPLTVYQSGRRVTGKALAQFNHIYQAFREQLEQEETR